MKQNKTQNKQNKQKNFKKGFTLLELLIVVLIIGILAGIALPQYKKAVGKTKFSELKTLAKSIAGAAQRYYLTHDTYSSITISKLDIEIPEDSQCGIHAGSQDDQNYLQCNREIFGITMYFYVKRDTGSPLFCIAQSKDINDNANRICQQETKKTAPEVQTDIWNRYRY